MTTEAKKEGRPPVGRALKENSGTVKRILSYLKPYRLHMAAVTLCILISAITSVVGTMFIRTIIDEYITPAIGQQNPDLTGLLRVIGTLGAIYAAGVFSSFIYSRVMVLVSQGVMKDVRNNMFDGMQKLPLSFFDGRTHGDVMSRYTNDTETLADLIAQSIPQTINSTVTLVSVLASMFSMSLWLTLLLLATVYPMARITMSVAKKSSKYYQGRQKALGDLNGYIEEMIAGQKVVKVFCHEDVARQGFDERNEALCTVATNADKTANALMPILANIGYIQYVLMAICGGAMAIAGVPGMTLGTIAAFLTLAKRFHMPMNQLSQQLNSIVLALAGAGRIFELIDQKPEADEGKVTLVNAKMENGVLVESAEETGEWAWKQPDSDGFKLTPVKGDVRLKNVDFAYVEGKTVLHDMSLYAKPGQKIAFVGATGAGKTTITNLINRFYDIQEGEITYDGIDVRDIKKDALRGSLGMVLQDVNLFTGTVRENIRYGKLTATDEEVVAAAKLANAHDFIMRLPKGYDTLLEGDGSGLSQGQRQLISIARAACENAPVMIMDEATSSIDTRTEAIVQSGMDRLMHGRTVFVIAHRLSTVSNANAIMVLEDGRIIERGDHDELIAMKGKYYKLYTGMLA